MRKKTITFKANQEMISGSILYKNTKNYKDEMGENMGEKYDKVEKYDPKGKDDKDDKDKNSFSPNFVFFHGGTGTKERIYNIIPPIVERGTGVLSIDFSGHGESTGELKKSSLKKRVEEAKIAIDTYIENNGPLIICGASMGGYIAIKMLELYKVKSLILFCPALYDKNAYKVPFDEGFTDIIRTPQSWRNTDALRILEDFTGDLLVIAGDKDEVIPAEVNPLIMQHTPNVRKKELYTIPECSHKIFDWVSDKDHELKGIQQKIIDL